MTTVRVNLGERSYDIRIGRGLRPEIPPDRAVVIADERVAALAGTLNVKNILTIPSGEGSKSLEKLSVIYDCLAGMNADRQTAVIAVGGGVIGDLAGFAAATYNRGLPLIMMPTTLLAMVDSSVGGKTGINHASGKNLIGAFHQPSGVVIDLDALRTLPAREFLSGLAEVVKYGVILDAPFFEWLEANAEAVLVRKDDALEFLIARCCQLKANVVEQDERETTGLRAVLNYGHTFGHAYETLGQYSQWLHGEAVSLGMTMAAKLAGKLKRIDQTFQDRQFQLLKRFQLPVQPPRCEPAAMLAVMRRDKKTLSGKLRFVLPSRLGEVELVDGVPEETVREVLESL